MKPKEQILDQEESHAISGPAGIDAKSCSQMGFAGPCFSKNQQGLTFIDKTELCKILDVLNVEPRLEAPVEGLEGEPFRKAGFLDTTLQGSSIEGVELFIDKTGQEGEMALTLDSGHLKGFVQSLGHVV